MIQSITTNKNACSWNPRKYHIFAHKKTKSTNRYRISSIFLLYYAYLWHKEDIQKQMHKLI